MSNDSKNGNMYALEVNPKIITIEPNSSIQLQIITQVEYDYKIQPEGYITYDIKSNTITGVREGIGSIEIFTFTKQEVLDDSEYEDENKTILKPLQKDEYGNDIPRKTNIIITKKDSRIIQVEVVKNVKQRRPRIMFHNRGTNQLTTIEIDPNTDNNVVFDLPIKDGILASTNTRANPAIITTPYIVTPEAKITLEYEGYLEFSSYRSINNDKYKHKRTIVQYSRNSTFTDLLCEETFETNNLTKAGCKYFGIGVYVRFKYCTIENIESEWSEYKYYEYRINTKEGGRNEVVVGDIKTSGYFGVIPKETYVSNRLMLGSLHWMIGNGISHFDYEKDCVVYYKNKLYRIKNESALTNAGKQILNTHNASIKIREFYKKVKDTYRDWPDLDPNDFEEDTREGLSTTRHLLKHQIGCMWKNTNDNKYVFWDSNYWLKFIINGKLIFIPDNKVYHLINWDEVAKYDLVYGDKTVKMGSSMYRIRLPKEEEFREILRLTNEYKKIAPIDEVTFFTPPKYTLVEDFYVYQEPADKTKRDNDTIKRYGRKVIDGNGVVKLAPQDATEVFEISYIPVLELIQPYDEPYKHFPLTTFNPDGFYPADFKEPDNIFPYLKKPTNESGYDLHEIYESYETGNGEEFIYDPLFDRGVFVMLQEGKHIWSTDEIITLMGITQSSNYIPTACGELGLWGKFYFRGQIIYVTPSRQSLSPDNSYNYMKNQGQHYRYKNYIRTSNTCIDTKADYFRDIKRYVSYKDYVYALLIKNNITHIAKDKLYENKEEVKNLLEKYADRDDVLNLDYELLNNDEKYELNIPEKYTVFFSTLTGMVFNPDVQILFKTYKIRDDVNIDNYRQIIYMMYVMQYTGLTCLLGSEFNFDQYDARHILYGGNGYQKIKFAYDTRREFIGSDYAVPSGIIPLTIGSKSRVDLLSPAYLFYPKQLGGTTSSKFVDNEHAPMENNVIGTIMTNNYERWVSDGEYHRCFYLLLIQNVTAVINNDLYFRTLYHNTIPYIYKRNEELEFITNSLGISNNELLSLTRVNLKFTPLSSEYDSSKWSYYGNISGGSVYIDWARTDNGYTSKTVYSYNSKARYPDNNQIIIRNPVNGVIFYVYNSDDTLKAVVDANGNILLLRNENYY